MSLYQHQADGAHWLASRRRGYLGDVPGLGKTRTVIAALDTNDNATKPLIVCPAIVRTHWAREFGAYHWAGDAVIKSYDEIVRGGNALMRDLIQDEQIDALVLDEAHYLKHANSKRTQLLLGINGYARRLPRVYAISGTPVPKNPSELWTVLSSLFPEVALEHKLRSFQAFRDRFCAVRLRMVRGRMEEKILPEVRHEAEFREILSKIMLRRTLDDVGLDVPELDWQVVRLDSGSSLGEFAPDAASGDAGLLNAHYAAGKIAAEGVARSGELAGLTLESIANDPHVARMRRRLGELKIAPAAELIASQLADSDEKIVVFAHHKSVMHGLRELLKNYGVCYIDGETPPTRRDAEIDRFQTDPAARVFLGQNLACQTGVTLTAARRVVLVEPDWTADTNLQLGKRVARIGQTAGRCIGQMVCLAGTLDEAIVGQNIQEVRMSECIGLGTNR